MKTWEYDQILMRPDADEGGSTANLDSLGKRGGELVAAVPAGANYIRFFFKRPANSLELQP